MVVIYKGEDTRFANLRQIVFTVQADQISLSGWSARFFFMGIDKCVQSTPPATGPWSFTVEYTTDETREMPLGMNYGTLHLYDAENRHAQTAKVQVDVRFNPCTCGIAANNQVKVNASNVFVDYNQSANKPKINGVTVEGTKTSADYGILSVEGLNAEIARATAAEAALGTRIDNVRQVPSGGTTGQVLTKGSSGYGWSTPSQGTVNYNDLTNKPSINNVTLSGNKTAADLALATSTQGAKADTAMQHSEFSELASIDDLVPDETGITQICNIINKMKNLLKPAVACVAIVISSFLSLGAAETQTAKLSSLVGKNLVVTNVVGLSDLVTESVTNGLASTNYVIETSALAVTNNVSEWALKGKVAPQGMTTNEVMGIVESSFVGGTQKVNTVTGLFDSNNKISYLNIKNAPWATKTYVYDADVSLQEGYEAADEELQGSIDSLESRMGTAEANIINANNSIAAVGSRVSVIEGNYATQGDLGDLEDGIYAKTLNGTTTTTTGGKKNFVADLSLRIDMNCEQFEAPWLKANKKESSILGTNLWYYKKHDLPNVEPGDEIARLRDLDPFVDANAVTSIVKSAAVTNAGAVAAAQAMTNGITFAQLKNKPTTLEGYGIADAYTKTDVNTISNGAVTAANAYADWKFLPMDDGTGNNSTMTWSGCNLNFRGGGVGSIIGTMWTIYDATGYADFNGGYKRNGTDLDDIYLGKNAQAADSKKLNGRTEAQVVAGLITAPTATNAAEAVVDTLYTAADRIAVTNGTSKTALKRDVTDIYTDMTNATYTATNSVKYIENIVTNTGAYFEFGQEGLDLIKTNILVFSSEYELTNLVSDAAIELFSGRTAFVHITEPHTNLTINLKFPKNNQKMGDAMLRIYAPVAGYIETLTLDGYAAEKVVFNGCKSDDWEFDVGDHLYGFDKTIVTNGVAEVWVSHAKSER